MSESKQRQFHTPELKAKVGLEAIRGIKTLNEIALEFGVHPVQVGQWKKEIQDHAKTLFEGKRGFSLRQKSCLDFRQNLLINSPSMVQALLRSVVQREITVFQGRSWLSMLMARGFLLEGGHGLEKTFLRQIEQVVYMLVDSLN